MRVGFGYDVHPLVSGRHLVLGGQNIPFDRGLEGYSDADVLVHAIMDALLGAAGLKDIGTQFPSGDAEYENISSLVLLDQVNRLLRQNGFEIGNIDTTVVAQQPKIAPFIDAMRETISKTLEIHSGQVMVKATTTDGIGSIGKGEGIAAYAIALILKKD
ncbi:MAG: 2-C-methyl-D-erythritol 2,4-cyclodiphosphate synthase [Dehalococcoidia bacterium]